MNLTEKLIIVALVAVVVALFAWAAIPTKKRFLLLCHFMRPSRARPIALANALGLFGQHGRDNLLLDPNSTNAPFPGRWLLIQRGASGYQYGDLCAGGAGGTLPLGVSPDSPEFTGDILAVDRLGIVDEFLIGIVAPNTTATIDHLLVSAANGKVQDITTVTANGVYWVVGRAMATVNAATSSTGEVPYAHFAPYQITVSNNGGTYVYSGAGN
ncbi:MAG TPA: hypothetical protein VGY56_10675 [Verrucomicrobiae bacterium]|nr:hypothetical protein [Verrucomicrobiae bacterium]